eukprot:CAMPEP_0172501602 /NCGR_PEP_ID=MMETSP1066-20121228/151334_1 /TAXON_ID=671091 /ORGANISM="Coscinodiscus wailesii, Strain CCMP2513" /LENGTH=330 /DNA_ID=CAMNT_0013276481 /DNA_START=198 /DNA_END=1190 /DNA_ORIENTATION=-
MMNYDSDDGPSSSHTRRKFLWQSTTSAATLLSVAKVVHADDEMMVEQEKAITELVTQVPSGQDETTVQQISSSSLDSASPSDPPTPQTLGEQSAMQETLKEPPLSSSSSPSPVENNELMVIKDEKELINELVEEERDDEKAVQDTQKLIAELEEQIKVEEGLDATTTSPTSSVTNELDKLLDLNKELLDTLEKEEERIENETKEIIAKIEIIEKETKDLDNLGGGATNSPPTPTTQEFLEKLNKRVEEKEDLITRLKKRSEKDIDPKTGKFKTMTQKEFKDRAPSDFDFLGYLKQSITNTEEFERDLDAFKGLLENKFGPVLEEVKNFVK